MKDFKLKIFSNEKVKNLVQTRFLLFMIIKFKKIIKLYKLPQENKVWKYSNKSHWIN